MNLVLIDHPDFRLDISGLRVEEVFYIRTYLDLPTGELYYTVEKKYNDPFVSKPMKWSKLSTALNWSTWGTLEEPAHRVEYIPEVQRYKLTCGKYSMPVYIDIPAELEEEVITYQTLKKLAS